MSPDPIVSALIDVDETAALVKVSVSTWRRMLARGEGLTPITLGRVCQRWRRAEVLAWVEAGCPSRAEWLARRAARR